MHATNINNSNDCIRDCITIGRMAPNFTALSTNGFITLSQFRGKWVMLLSEPSAFAAVPTTSIVELARMYDEFKRRNVQPLVVTLDNNFSNIEWLKSIYNNYNIEVPFPILEDRDKNIADSYGMVNPDRIYEESVRDLFIISPSGKIRAIITYPVSCGRNFYEILRVIDSLQLTETHNVYTPSNWMPGDPVIIPSVSTFEEAINIEDMAKSKGLDCTTWYNCYENYYNLGYPTIVDTEI